MNLISLRLVLALCMLLVLPRGATAEALIMVYRDKPPYSYLERGVAKGFLLERTRRVLSRAGIEAQFREMPPKRIFLEIEENKQAICSFGWYKIAERERYALFSVPLHQDLAHLVLAGPRSVEAVRRHLTLQSLMADRSLTWAGADGVSYGPALDRMIAQFPGQIERSLQSPLQVAQKIAAQRADFMFIDREDFNYLSASSSDFTNKSLVPINYPDMPPGLERHILCSQQVGAEVMRRINAAIALEPAR